MSALNRNHWLIAALTILVIASWGASVRAQDLKLAHGYASGSAPDEVARMFAARASERMGANIRVFGSGQIAREADVPPLLSSGQIDLAVATGSVSRSVPEFGVFEMPFLFRNGEHFRAVSDGLLREFLNERSQQRGFVVLAVLDFGMRHVASSGRPILLPSDLKGVKIRVAGQAWVEEMFSILGASTVMLPFSETFAASRSGVIDANETTLEAMVRSKLFEVQKFVSLTGHAMTPGYLLMSRQSFEKLAEDKRTELLGAALEARDGLLGQVAQRERESFDRLTSSGIEIIEARRDEFTKVGSLVYDSFSQKVHGGSKLISFALRSK